MFGALLSLSSPSYHIHHLIVRHSILHVDVFDLSLPEMMGLMRLSGVPTRRQPYQPFPVHSLDGRLPEARLDTYVCHAQNIFDNVWYMYRLYLSLQLLTPDVTCSRRQERFTKFICLKSLKKEKKMSVMSSPAMGLGDHMKQALEHDVHVVRS